MAYNLAELFQFYSFVLVYRVLYIVSLIQVQLSCKLCAKILGVPNDFWIELLILLTFLNRNYITYYKLLIAYRYFWGSLRSDKTTNFCTDLKVIDNLCLAFILLLLR